MHTQYTSTTPMGVKRVDFKQRIMSTWLASHLGNMAGDGYLIKNCGMDIGHHELRIGMGEYIGGSSEYVGISMLSSNL